MMQGSLHLTTLKMGPEYSQKLLFLVADMIRCVVAWGADGWVLGFRV